MNFIKKLLIKNYADTSSPSVRFSYGIVAGIFGIISNVLLCSLKLAVGIISGSIAIIADAINNLSDAGSSVITVFGFKLSARPADKEHPFGHARYEYISGLIVAFLVLAVGVLLAKSSIEKIISPEQLTVGTFTYVVLGLAIAMKLFQMLLYRNFAKSIDSDALAASATDSRNDVLSTVAVLISTLVVHFSGVNIDAYVGLLASVFILISSLKLIKETIDPLLGTVPDKLLVKKIRDKLMSYDGVLGIHDLAIHNYGAVNCFAIVHVEVDAKSDFLAAHDLIDNIERDFHEQLGISLSIHMDPIETDNEMVNKLKAIIVDALAKLDGNLSIHDFRIVVGATHTNLLFDVVIPFESHTTKDEVLTACQKTLDEFDAQTTYHLVVDVDHVYS